MLFALLLGCSSVFSAVLVPSSQFSISLTPTFSELTRDSLVELQHHMEDILMRTTEIIHRGSMQPTDINVIIQGAVPVSYNTHTSFELKTTNVTFAVLGTFDEVRTTADQKFMDSLVVQAFDRATFKDLLLSLLQESSNEPLSQVVELALRKELTTVPAGGLNANTVAPSPPESIEGLTPVDVSLIVVSSLILVVIVLVLLHGRSRRPKTLTHHTNKRSHQSPGSSTRKFATTTSFDESFSSSSPISQDERMAAFNLSQAATPNFRIMKHSPPNGVEKSLSNATTIKMSNRSPSSEDVTIAMTTPSPSALEMTSGSSDSEDGFSRSGDLAHALDIMSERFSSKWFEGSQTSFSVDSHDIFGVGVSGKADESQGFTSTNSASYRGQSMEEWARSIRVVSAAGSATSAPSLRSAPESLSHFETDAFDEECYGRLSI